MVSHPDDREPQPMKGGYEDDVVAIKAVVAHAMPFTHPDPSIARILQIWHATARAQAKHMAKVRPALWLTTKAMPEGLR